MATKYSGNKTTKNNFLDFLSDFIVVNRLSETVGYNVLYFIIGVGLAASSNFGAILSEHFDLLLVTFFAVMFSKMQASVADAVHDYDIDRENPEKSFIASAVESIGKRLLFTILIVELIVGMGLWGWLALETDMLFFLLIGVASNVLGFVYSFPPRIKERGIVNHLVTTGVDVVGVVLPVALAAGAVITPEIGLALLIVYMYGLGYHVMHQAADTVYDRQSGISTFTQSIGITESVWFAAILTGVAAILSLSRSYTLCAVGLFVVTGAYVVLANSIRNKPPRTQCDNIARWFKIGPWAIGINFLFAFNLYL